MTTDDERRINTERFQGWREVTPSEFARFVDAHPGLITIVRPGEHPDQSAGVAAQWPAFTMSECHAFLDAARMYVDDVDAEPRHPLVAMQADNRSFIRG